MPAAVRRDAPVAPAQRRGRRGALTADALLEPWFASLRPHLGDTRIFDAHTHLGCADPDGSCFGAAELRGALDLTRAYPHAPLILAHAAITDLAWIWHEAAGRRNQFFDTAWWNTADQLALFALIPPGQILFASDTPYGRTVAAASVVLRAALAAGLSREQIGSVAGGQLERLLAGLEPRDVGPAPMTTAPGPGPLLERVHTLLVAAAGRLTAGYPADEYLELARLACELPIDHPDAEAAASVRELLDRHAAFTATDPLRHGPRPPGIHMIFVAAALARLPVAGAR